MTDTLGQRIQDFRTGLGLSQEALGAQLGVSRQAVSKWEADGAVPDTDKLIALSKLFGVSLNELLAVGSPAAETEASAPVSPARKGRLLVVLTLLLAAALAAAGFRLSALHRQVTALEETVAELEQAQPLISHYSYTAEPQGGKNSVGIYTVQLFAARDLDGAQVSVLLTDNQGGSKEIKAEKGDAPGVYTAALSYSLNNADGLTISALIRSGDWLRTQPLVELSELVIVNNSIGYVSRDLLNS